MGAWVVAPARDVEPDASLDPDRVELDAIGGVVATSIIFGSSARWDLMKVRKPTAAAVLEGLLSHHELKGTVWEARLRQELERLKPAP